MAAAPEPPRAASSVTTATRVLLFLAVLLTEQMMVAEALSIGVNYGQIANNLPSPGRVSWLLRSLRISKVKLYDADPHVLRAFLGTGVEFVVGIGNEHVPAMVSPAVAQAWVHQHLAPHLRAGARITCITVGNEVFKGNDTVLQASVLPAMQSVHQALGALGLHGRVNVTTAHSLDIMGVSYPPSAGAFHPGAVSHLQPFLSFLSATKSPFLINCYPYFAYKDDPARVPLEYVLFQPNAGVTDPHTRLNYDNMLYAQVDAVYAAIQALGYTDVHVKVSETGWPSRGDPDEYGATPEHAGTYIGNLLRRIEMKQGTPLRPAVPIDVYVFALFNENLKTGPASERNYGLFYPDGKPVYNVGLSGYLPPVADSGGARQASVLPAMQSVHQALGALGLHGRVNVTTAHSLDIMGVSYPPSAGVFHQGAVSHLRPFLSFLSATRSPFLINCYPYFAYKDDPARVPLEYVLFQPNAGVTDPHTGLNYDNMLYAQVDAMYAAIQALGYTDVHVKVSETGWPSRGDPNEYGATPEHAVTYIGNLLRRIEAKQGTPLRPAVPIDVYVFAVFNENLKPGPASERNYGLFYPDGTPVYNVGLSGYLPPVADSGGARQGKILNNPERDGVYVQDPGGIIHLVP